MIAMILSFINKRNTQTITAVMPALMLYPMLALLQGGSSLARAQKKRETRWRGVLVFAFFASLLIDRFSAETAVAGCLGPLCGPRNPAGVPPA